jgi:hypothetical protein
MLPTSLFEQRNKREARAALAPKRNRETSLSFLRGTDISDADTTLEPSEK